MYTTYLGVFLGSLTRTLVPYLVKLKKDPRIRWKNTYLVSAIAGLLLSVIATLVLASQVQQDIGLLGGFTLSYTLHSLSREVQKAVKNE